MAVFEGGNLRPAAKYSNFATHLNCQSGRTAKPHTGQSNTRARQPNTELYQPDTELG